MITPLRILGALASAVLFYSGGAFAESDDTARKAYLLSDWAAEKDGTLVIDEFHHCRVRPRTGWGTSLPQSFTFHFRSEANPREFSRDRFVALSARAKWVMLGRTGERYPGISGMDAMGAVKCQPTSQAISNPDQEVKLLMGPDKLRMELWDGRKGTGDRMTDTWENLLGF